MAADVTLRSLHPRAGETRARDAFAELDLGALAPPERPYVAVNFAASIDGKATLEGRSGPLSSEADRALFHALRARVDAVMAGTGTLRIERYGPIVRDPELRAARERAGLAPSPLAVTISRAHALPLEIPLFEDPDSQVVVYAGAQVPEPRCAAQVSVTRLAEAELTPAEVLRRLRAEHGVRSLLCEGGPTLMNALVADDVVDELFLCVSPQLTGGEHALTIASGPQLAEPRRMALRGVLEHESFLFLRYTRQGERTPAGAEGPQSGPG